METLTVAVATKLTLELFLPCVSTHMPHGRVLATECLSARIAAVGFLARMRSQVVPQMRALGECSGALITTEGLVKALNSLQLWEEVCNGVGARG